VTHFASPEVPLDAHGKISLRKILYSRALSRIGAPVWELAPVWEPASVWA